jgi:glycosyltransferase involved in cell wall biosynthesis
VKQALRRLYLRSFDLIIVASALEERDSSRGRPRTRSAVIPHPLPAGGVRARPRRSPPPRGVIRLGYLGRLDPKKNVDLLLRALAALPETVRLRIAGDGPPELRESLSALMGQLGIESRVEWLGFVSTKEKPRFFDSIHLLVMPSSYECFGMAAAEALRAHVPVLVSRQTGIAETVERYDCGYVTPVTVDGLAGTILSILADREGLAARAARAAEVAAQEFSLDAHGARLRYEYEQLLKRREAPGDPKVALERSRRVDAPELSSR